MEESRPERPSRQCRRRFQPPTPPEFSSEMILMRPAFGVALPPDSHHPLRAVGFDQRDSESQAADELRPGQVEGETRIRPENPAAVPLPVDLTDLSRLGAQVRTPEGWVGGKPI